MVPVSVFCVLSMSSPETILKDRLVEQGKYQPAELQNGFCFQNLVCFLDLLNICGSAPFLKGIVCLKEAWTLGALKSNVWYPVARQMLVKGKRSVFTVLVLGLDYS